MAVKAEDRAGPKTLRLFRLWLFSVLSAMVLEGDLRRLSVDKLDGTPEEEGIKRSVATDSRSEGKTVKVLNWWVRGDFCQLRLGL